MNIEAVAPAGHELERFLERWPFKPHRWGGTPDGLQRLLVGRVRHTLDERGVRVWTATHGTSVAGFLTLRPLAWDTRVLSMPAARLELYVDGPYDEGRATAGALLAAAVQSSREQGLRHLSIRVDAGDDAAVHTLEAQDFLNVDALMTFAAATAALPSSPAPLAGIAVRIATPADAGAVGTIAADSFRDGRFHADPSVPARVARDVYRTWAAACCDGSAADASFVAEDSTGAVAFIACRMLRDTAVHLQRATGTIPLIASGEAVRGRGVGLALIGAAAEWFRSEAAAVVEVGTQLRNIAAGRLYERCGFRLAAGSQSFRLMVEQ